MPVMVVPVVSLIIENQPLKVALVVVMADLLVAEVVMADLVVEQLVVIEAVAEADLVDI